MSDGKAPRVAILCGGRGTRIARGDEDAPKPLVQVGERPILWHVMALYAAQGFNDFLLLTGWRSEQVASSVAEFPQIVSGAWTAECVDTGEDTPTGGRVHAVRERLRGETFALTYADGVADIDLTAELEFHREHGGLATIAVTRPRSPWGEAQLGDDDRVTGFVEKPQLENWINGGFMFLEDGALEFISADDILEQRPLENLAAAEELHAYKHDGFWDCMDTFKDALELNRLCAAGTPPWLAQQAAALGGPR
ncbi:MAG: NTP transferase domain-containing protein [Thermoleophilaceae bacterium]|nr:NTP transferase domain-containing protein [Thermoleophilaceae bacterium]